MIGHIQSLDFYFWISGLVCMLLSTIIVAVAVKTDKSVETTNNYKEKVFTSTRGGAAWAALICGLLIPVVTFLILAVAWYAGKPN